MVRYYVENFGCRASRADGDSIAAQLEAFGASAAEGVEQADVVVLNTCTVTAEADRDARARIRRIRRENPQTRIVVTGCYAQRAAEEVALLPGVNAVVGNSHKNQVAAVALGSLRGSGPSTSFIPASSLLANRSAEPSRPFLLHGDIFAHSEFQLPPFPAKSAGYPAGAGLAHRTRPSLKIQDGCGNRCTFCIIPSTRGNSRSLGRQQVLDAVRSFIDEDGKELVLSGINLGRWGRDLFPQSRLEDLVAEILEATPLPRLRLSSIEPMDWSDGLIALFAGWGTGPFPRLARHAHLPLQSGSDRVLRRMHRRYRPWHYAERVQAIHAACPDAGLGADIMVGFPGETAAEFQESYDFIAALPFTYLHLFPFSARPGTAAWGLHRERPVPGATVRERMTALRTLIGRKNLAFRSRFIGRNLSAVTLVPEPMAAASQQGCALSDNFLPVRLDDFRGPNLLISAAITGIEGHGLTGAHALPLKSFVSLGTTPHRSAPSY